MTQNEDYQEALRHIQKAKTANAVDLDLSESELTVSS